MKRFTHFLVISGLLTAGVAMIAIGCSQSPVPTASDSSSAVGSGGRPSESAELDEEHPHVPGAHGGIIVPIGADSYHAEAVVEKDGVIRLFMLGADETRIHEVDIQSVKAFVKASGETDAIPIEMTATPQDGDASGKTSQFVGKLPDTAIGRAVDVTIPNLRIGTERFRVGFTSAVQVHDSGMPAGVTGEEEQRLYFTATGKYTEADIKANGNQTASVKFRGFMSKHDMNPKPGDLICPVTFTKANPTVAWQVNGKKYLFCCPPCVDEFVRMAKEEPESVLEPEDYVQGERKAGSQKEATVVDAAADSANSIDPEITAALAQLSAEDRQLAIAQKFCAVATSSALGSMGTPIKLEINGESVLLCCEGCRTRALRQPEVTLASVAKLKQENTAKE